MTVSNCVIQKTLRRTLDCVSPAINNAVFCIRIVDHLNCIHYHPSLPLKTIISRGKKRKRDPCYHGWPPCHFCGRAFLCEPTNRNNLKNNIRGKVFKFTDDSVKSQKTIFISWLKAISNSELLISNV